MKKLWAIHKTLLSRIFREVWFPFLAAAVWAILALKSGKSPFDSFSTFGATFFFIFFLQGQVLRISKNLRDENNANEFRDNFASIHEALDAIKRQAQPQPQTHPVGRRRTTDSAYSKRVRPEAIDQDTKYYFDEAARAIDNGFLYPATLVAATGFEHALREIGKRFKYDARKPIRTVIEELGTRLDKPELTKQLLLLMRLRNTLIHEQALSRPKNVEEAQSIVRAFEDGLSKLEYEMHRHYGS